MPIRKYSDDDYEGIKSAVREAAEQKQKFILRTIKIVAICIVLLIIAFSSFYQVNAGERGILLTFGNPDMTPKSEGLHFKIPIVQTAEIMDIKTQKYTVEKASSASKDLQTVTTDVAINYYISPENVPVIYKTIGVNYQDKIIAPAVQEVVKANTAQYTAEELITKRPEVKEKIDVGLRDRLKEFNIIVQAISITNFEFSPEFNKAIEAKVTAEQNALAAKNKLEQVKYEAEQRITQAKGESEAIRIQSEAITRQGGKDYVQLQMIQKWNGQSPNIVVVGENGNTIAPFLQLTTP